MTKIGSQQISNPLGQPERIAERVALRLYIAGRSQNSLLALANLRQLCERHLPEGYELEVIDILTDAERAHRDGVLITPTLVKLSPLPKIRVVGTLGQEQEFRTLFGLDYQDRS